MEEHDNTAETPWEDLRKGALDHYEKISSVAHEWQSVIPEAINFYFDHGKNYLMDEQGIREV